MSENLRLFLKYIVPSMAGMAVVGSYSIIDTVFIGQAAGETGLAAVAIAWPPLMFFYAVGDMLGGGASVIIAQSIGRKDPEHAFGAFHNMLFLILSSGTAITLFLFLFLKEILYLSGSEGELMTASFSYAKIGLIGGIFSMLQVAFLSVIRNDGRPVLAMWLVIIGLLVNIGLDYIFIFPLELGIDGAATATVISEILVTLIGCAYFLSKHTKLTLRLKNISLSVCTDIAQKGIPSLGGQLSILSMLFLHNFQSLKYGSVAGLAAYTFISAIEAMGSLLMTGLANGIQPLVSYFFGAKKTRRQKIIGQYGYLAAFFLGIVMMLISVAGHTVFPHWFGLKDSVAALAGHGLIISSTAFILLGVIRVAGSYYQSINKIWESSVLIYGDSFFALPLCLILLPLAFGLDGVWLAMPVSRLLLFSLLLWFWRKDKGHSAK